MKRFPAAALFDLDGVLIDTETIYTSIWEDIARAFPTGVERMAHKIKGMTLAQILDIYYPDEDTRRGVCDLLSEREATMDYLLFPGADAFLEQLDAAGIPSVIVTSSNDSKMERLSRMYPSFMGHFKAMVTDSAVTHSKPHPEPYLLGAGAAGVEAARCIVFEDSFSGMSSGRAAGAAVVGVATTNSRESIVDRADVVIDGFAGLSLESLLDMLSAAGRSF